jgi:hypothetical protein
VIAPDIHSGRYECPQVPHGGGSYRLGTGAQGRGERKHPMDTQVQVRKLEDKVSLLAMQKDYWWQRSTEDRSARHLAEAEVRRLKAALDGNR